MADEAAVMDAPVEVETRQEDSFPQEAEPKEQAPQDVPFDGIEDPSQKKTSLEEDAQAEEAVPGEDEKKEPKPDDENSIDGETLQKAKEFGFSDQEISDLGQKRLDLMLSKIEARQTAQKPAEKPAETPPPAAESEFKMDDEALSAFDPELVKPIKAMHEHYEKKIAGQAKAFDEMKGFVSYLAGHIQQQQQREYSDWVDGQFAAMGEEYASVFGKESRLEIERNSPQMKARHKLLDTMDLIAKGYEGRKQQAPNRGDLMKQALRMAFGEKQGEIERKKITTAMDKRKGQMIARPTNRTSPDNRTREDIAIENIRKKMKDKGMDEEESIF